MVHQKSHIGKALICVVVAVLLASGGYLLTSNRSGEVPTDSASPFAPFARQVIDDERKADDAALPTAPGLADPKLIAPLADSYRRIDPSEDGWQSEAFSEAATAQLAKLAHLLEEADSVKAQAASALATSRFSSGSLRPKTQRTVFDDGVLAVTRHTEASSAGDARMDRRSLDDAIGELAAAFREATDVHAKLKLVQVEPEEDRVSTLVYVLASGTTDKGTLQVNATWRCDWTVYDSQPPLLDSIRAEAHEESFYRSTMQGKTLFSDCTESVLGKNASYRQQLLYPTDHWRSRLVRDLGLDVVANHGMAIGDVNGDGLDDIYICQQGGIPNRLFLRNADGTLTDVSRSSGADWLEYCASALIVDLDNDGDRDLVVAQEWRVLMMSNDGRGHFQLEFGLGTEAQAFSMSSADYDLDGDLDIFVCGYNPSGSNIRQGAMGEPVPFHDANNGGRNMLLKSVGNWEFQNVTTETGLDDNNSRFSFAAAWEDFDNDGDLDLYVANDYGRNNLYRNQAGHFRDVAGELGVEDMSAGMSTSWADFNHDGWMDLYVSNMFSAAGNRITYQRQFKDDVDEATRRQFQRHARGNSLFVNTGSGFRDVSATAGVTMGRWAWGSRFVDLNNDSLEDLVVANGFITATDTGDL